MARTPMAGLPWQIRTSFWVLRKFSNNSRKKNIWGFFLIYHEILCCVYSLELHLGDSNEYTQHTIIDQKIEKVSLNYRNGAMINP